MNTVATMARKVELYFWMARFPTETAVFTCAGWLVSTSSIDWRFAAVVAGTVAGRATANLLNDVLDAEKDQTTAPDLPIPSGRVTVREATRVALALLLGALAAILAATPTAATRAAAAVVVMTGMAMVVLYSKVKSTGLPASLLAAALFWMPAALGWLAGGAEHAGDFAVLLLGLEIIGVRGNIYAGIRDIDTDPLVGNITTAVRLGLERSVAWSILLSSAAGLTCVWLSVARHNLVGLAWALFATALPLIRFRRHRAALVNDGERSRGSRTVVLTSMRIAAQPVMIGFGIAASPLIGLLVGAAVAPFGQFLFRIYLRRMPAVLGTAS